MPLSDPGDAGDQRRCQHPKRTDGFSHAFTGSVLLRFKPFPNHRRGGQGHKECADINHQQQPDIMGGQEQTRKHRRYQVPGAVRHGGQTVCLCIQPRQQSS